jgi:hypothetical protein
MIKGGFGEVIKRMNFSGKGNSAWNYYGIVIVKRRMTDEKSENPSGMQMKGLDSNTEIRSEQYS